MDIVYFLRDDGACAYYRVELPIQTLVHSSMGWHRCHRYGLGRGAENLEKALEQASIVVVPRIQDKMAMEVMRGLQKSGKKVVIDYDDNPFAPSPFSPHYARFGVEDVKVKTQDGILELWKDGERGFNIEKNKELIQYLKEAMGHADLVSCTQPELKKVFDKHSKNVVCLPNCVDMQLWERKEIVKENRDEIRIGLSGGASHYEDWCLLTTVLPVIMEKYKKAKLVIFGSSFEGPLKRLRPYKERVETHGWVATPAYPYKMALLNLDFMLIPLVDNEFNRCKSNIKWVEQGALKTPSVVSAVSPYKEWLTEANSVAIADNSPDAWIAGISYLIDNPLDRIKIGQEAYKTVLENFDIATQVWRWEKAYENLLTKAPSRDTLAEIKVT